MNPIQFGAVRHFSNRAEANPFLRSCKTRGVDTYTLDNAYLTLPPDEIKHGNSGQVITVLTGKDRDKFRPSIELLKNLVDFRSPFPPNSLSMTARAREAVQTTSTALGVGRKVIGLDSEVQHERAKQIKTLWLQHIDATIAELRAGLVKAFRFSVPPQA